MFFYAPNFGELDGHIGFGLCVPSMRPSVNQEPCTLGFWNFIYLFFMEKYLTHIFFLSELSPFLELCPFEKIRMKSVACHILLIVRARVSKFHIWIPHGKNADPFSCPSYLPFWSYAPLKNIRMKSCQQSIWARAWNLVSWLGMMSRLPD